MGIVKRHREGEWQYGVSRRLPPNKLGMKRFRRWYANRTQANKVIDILNGSIADGSIDDVLPGLVGIADQSYTVKTFSEIFINEYAKPRLSSWERYRQSFGFINDKLGNVPIGEFRRHHLHEFLEDRIEHVSRSTANKDIAAVKKMFSYALEIGAIALHPLIKFSIFKTQEIALRLPTIEEFRKLVDVQPTYQLRALVAVLGETGMRKNEALNLTWQHIDLDKKRVLAEKTKGRKVRSIPLTDFAIDKLRALTRIVGNQNVFVYDSGLNFGKKVKRPYKAYRSAAKSIGLEWVTFHTLRHMRGTLWLQHGADIRDVQIGLGHASVTTTMRYLKHTETHVDQSLRSAQENEIKTARIEPKRDKNGTRKKCAI